jgi:hypothetical protein
MHTGVGRLLESVQAVGSDKGLLTPESEPKVILAKEDPMAKKKDKKKGKKKGGKKKKK